MLFKSLLDGNSTKYQGPSDNMGSKTNDPRSSEKAIWRSQEAKVQDSKRHKRRVPWLVVEGRTMRARQTTLDLAMIMG